MTMGIDDVKGIVDDVGGAVVIIVSQGNGACGGREYGVNQRVEGGCIPLYTNDGSCSSFWDNEASS